MTLQWEYQILADENKVDTMTAESTTQEKPTIEGALAKMEEIYVNAFTETILPFVIDASRYSPAGHVTAKATASASGVNLTVGFEFEQKHPDIFEQAQRYIFIEIFNRFVNDYNNR